MLLNFYCHYYVGLLKRELEKHILSFTLEICLIIQSVGLNHVQFQLRKAEYRAKRNLRLMRLPMKLDVIFAMQRTTLIIYIFFS